MRLNCVIIFASIVLFTFESCNKNANDELSHHSHEHNHGHGHNDGEEESKEGIIELSPAVADRFDVRIEKAAMQRISAVVKTGAVVENATEGMAVVSTPTAGILTFSRGIELGSHVNPGSVIATVSAQGVSGGDVNKVAKIELESAKAEFERIDNLYADRLVTLSQYNSAKAAYERAKASYSASAESGRVKSPVSGTIINLDVKSGQYVEAGMPVASVAASDRLIVRANVPTKSYRSIASARDARVILPSGGSILLSEIDGKRLDLNSSAASHAGYVPVTFSVDNDGSLFPGESVELYILGPAERETLAVPLTALTEQQGSFYVFEQLDEDCYRKLPVKTGISDGRYIEIIDGLKGDESIVSQGVAALRLAETSGAVPEGHSHSH